MSSIPSETLLAWLLSAAVCGPSHFSAGPWQASHDTPSEMNFSVDPTAWQLKQSLAFVGSPTPAISAIRFDRSFDRTL